jgi:hypothetical protein
MRHAWTCRLVLIIPLLRGVSSVAFSQTTDPMTASVSGVLIDEVGNFPAGVQVTANRVAGISLTPPFSGQSVNTAPGGLFTIHGLPQGLYRLCVSIPNSSWLDPCEWSKPETILLRSGEVAKGMWVRVAHGKMLDIRIDDIGNNLKSDSKGQLKHLVAVRLRSVGKVHEIPKLAEDAGGENHTIAVPLDTDLQLDVWSPTLSVKGDGEAADVNANEGKSNGNGTFTPGSFRLSKNDIHKSYKFKAQAGGK